MKDSGVEWLGEISSGWQLFRLGHLFRERREKVSDKDFPPLSVTKQGIVPQLETAAKSDDGDNRKLVRAGDFVINSRSDRKGSSGLSRLDGSVSLINIVLEPRRIVPDFSHHLLRSYAFQEEFYRWGHGIVADLWTTCYSEMKDIRVLLPDRNLQQSIANFLDRETARIDQLIEKKQQLIEHASFRIEAIVDKVIYDTSIPNIRFEYLVNRVSRPVDLSEHEELVRLGLYNRGRGIFKKPAADEEGMGSSDFHFIKSGDLIISGQFAWEGAIAMATEAEAGCVVSHRYPVYRAIDGVNTAYLLGFLRTKLGDFLLNGCSRGSAGKNRPLNTWRLGKEKIPVPKIELQEEVERAVIAHRKIKAKTEASIQKLNEFRSALITAAVTGQIDVNEWSRRGHSDVKLDAIVSELTE